EPVDSLIMEDEHLDTVSEMESNEFIKSSVENLVPIPSESNHPIFNAHNDLLGSRTTLMEQMEQLTSMCEMFCQFIQKKQEEKRIEEESNSLKDNIISELPPCAAITPNEPVDSLIMEDEHLDTVSETESNEFIKSSVENLVPIPKIIPMKIDQHPFNAESDIIESMLNHDSSIIISSKIESLFDEFAGELTLLKSIPPGIDEADCHPEEETHFTKRLLYDNSSPRPPKEFVYDNSDVDIEFFSPSPIPVEDSDSRMEEINLTFTPDDPMPPGIEEDDYDFERDILILKDLPSNDTLSILEIESFRFYIPFFNHPPAKPPDGNTGILNIKMMGDISDQKVPMHKLMTTLASNQEESPDLLSHQGLKTF
nr:hypothetical protein [Tanacetum cinerariifolium]